MALRRELPKVAVLAATLLVLLLPAAAMAAPQWRPAETREATGSGAPADVASDADGNSVAVWLGPGGTVNAAYRPRGGPWEPADDLDPGTPLEGDAPLVTAQPDGQFVAVWLADRPLGEFSYPLRWARRPAGGDWSAPDTISGIGCCPGIAALEATADGSVTVVSTDEGSPSSNTKAPGSETWGADEFVPTGSGSRYAFGADGSAVAAGVDQCPSLACIEASYRPPGGTWGAVETAGIATEVSAAITGFEVAATPDSGYSVVWGEGQSGVGVIDPPGRVRSNDRTSGAGGAWGAAQMVVDLPADAPGCNSGNCFDLAVGTDGRQVAIWQQSGAAGDRMSAALRAAGGPWGVVENVGDPGSATAEPHAAVTTTDIPVVAWGSAGQNGAVAHGSHRSSAGSWQTVEIGTPSETTVRLGDVAIDADGNALTAWDEAPGGIYSAGFDGAGPRFSAFSLPSGSVGEAPFSAAADDNWSPPASIAWLFGDGAGAPGASVSHAYGAAGTFTATATATDAIGNATELSGTVAVTAAPTPTPDPCGTADADKDGIKDGCDDNNGATRPVAFKTVNATVVSGEVFVKLPAGAARASQAAKPPKGFVRLEGAETIPVGATLDTAKGRVRLRTASDTRKHVQTADFFRGRFVVRQVRQPRRKGKKRSTKLITDIILNGSSFRTACRTTTASVSQKRRRSKKRVRRLFGDGKGTFRTKGRNAAATVRGTRWSVQDRCDGTLVTVQRGRVEVRDLTKRKTVIVRTGKKYLARRR